MGISLGGTKQGPKKPKPKPAEPPKKQPPPKNNRRQIRILNFWALIGESR